MSIGVFTDKLHQPTDDEVQAMLGSAWTRWESLTQFVAQSYQIPVAWTFGGKNYGWNIWYRKGGKTLTSLYPQAEALTAQIVLGAKDVEQAMTLALGSNVRRLLEETPQLHDGRWLFIPVTTDQDVDDVKQLLLIKRRPVGKQGAHRG